MPMSTRADRVKEGLMMAQQRADNLEPPLDPQAKPLALFDLEGVLTNPIPGIISCHEEALKTVDLDFGQLAREHTDVAIEELVRASPEDVYTALRIERATASTVLTEYRERRPFAGLDDGLFPGAEDLLAQLSTAGWNLGVATNQLEPLAVRVLDRLELTTHFSIVVGSDVARTRATKRQIITHLMTRLDHQPSGVAVIGDRATDMVAAKSLSMTAIGAAWGFGSLEELMSANADAVALNSAEVADLLLGD